MDLEPCKIKYGRMAKLAHAPHLKCVGRNTLSVQIRLRPPYYNKRKEVLRMYKKEPVKRKVINGILGNMYSWKYI